MLTAWIAFTVQQVLTWTGVGALRHGAYLYVPGTFAYEISLGCSGLLPAGLVTAAILATPATGAAKRRGLLVGVPLVLALNLVRLAHLFHVGMRSPRLFALAHTLWWEAAIVAATFAVWLVWSRRAALSRVS
jgi:exosortase/archaeosortase family protein